MFEARLVIDVVIIIALGCRATFLRVFLRSALIDRDAVRSLASHDVHAILVFTFPSFLNSSALATVAEIFLEDGLTCCAVLARQIGTRVLSALFNAISLQDLFIAADMKIDEIPIDFQFSYATEEPMVGTDIVVNPAQIKSFRVIKFLDEMRGLDE